MQERLPGAGEAPNNGLEVAISCPITKQVMSSAVVALDGHTYERQAIESWFATHGTTSPVTGRRIESKLLIPNHAIRNMIRLAGLGGGISATLRKATAKDVPHHVLDFVFLYLDGVSLARGSQVCKQWQETSAEDHLWCYMLDTEYVTPGGHYSAMEGIQSYRDTYGQKHKETVERRRAKARSVSKAEAGAGFKLLRNGAPAARAR